MDLHLTCGDKVLDLSSPVIMGVLNITPDSFSDGGRFLQLDAALNHAELLVAEGAAILDIGAESTRPNATPVTEQQELDRLLPVIEAVKQRFDTIISIDTSSPAVMLAAASRGVGLLNDVRALQREGALQAAAQTQLPICLMHMQGQPTTMQQQPRYEDVIDEISAFFEQRIEACMAQGIARQRLLLDVGFGFGKTLNHNLQLLAHLSDFKVFDLPLLVGMSRKSMLGAILQGAPVDQRLYAGLSAAAIAVLNGAHIVRTHDVKATKEAVAVAHALLNS
ncbi:dihydropteroate synthase [Agitococcus lubricus]|uniref:Dihydropteroate synthase n=1 Tax=Agitococcus lubricus TaxID=1077255 RepID=A0A2T5J353_9GAMM|nr:dihydropteroate synthase [Agitococcus lubricus]PTQ91006.1 dihydropteroate synthase [Agitococcus lubricus]